MDHEGKVTREMGGGRGGRGARGGGPSFAFATGGNKEPLGHRGQQTNNEAQQAAQPTPKPTVPVPEKGNKEETPEVQSVQNVSGSGDWLPATGKRGRSSPSPDKLIKRAKGGGVLELKNKFQKLAESVFGGEGIDLQV